MDRPLSIRSLLLLTITALTLIIAVMATREAVMQWSQLTKVESLKKASVIGGHLFNLIEDISSEREVTYAILFSDDVTLIRRLRPRMEQDRKETDAEAARVFNELRPYALGSFMQTAQKNYATVQTLRGEVDQALGLPLNTRAAGLSARWFNGSSAFNTSTFDLWMDFTRGFTTIDPVVTQRFIFQHFLGTILRYSGRERAIIGGLIVANRSVSFAEQANLLEWHGTAEQSWGMCSRLADRSLMGAEIAPYLKDAESHYDTVYDMVRELFYVPTAERVANYPITIDLWLEVVTDTTDSLFALKNKSLQLTQAYVDGLEQQARRSIVIHLFILLGAACICVYSFWIVNCRVIGPIRHMIQALLDTAEGKPFQPPKLMGQGDEISNLMQVLYDFQESQQRYRALIEASAQIVWVWRHGNIDVTSPLGKWWEETTGQPAESIATTGWLAVVHPDDRGRMRLIWEEALAEKKSFETEYRLRARSGKYLHVELRGVPLLAPNGTLREFIGSVNDITARKEAEAKTGLLASIVASSEDAILSKALDGTITSWNTGAEHLFGYSAAEALGKHISLIIPPERIVEEKHIVTELTADRKIEHMETVRMRKNGQYVHVSLTVSPLYDATGRIVGASKIIRDITARKDAEEKLLRYTQALERSNKELDDFAYIASHDLKEPLRGLHNHSRFLLEDNEGKLDPESNDRLHRLLYLTQRMEKLVNDLLYFSRLGRQELAFQPMDLNEVIRDIETTTDVFLHERHARIIVPNKLPTIICDKSRITEVFRNLITNAAKYNTQKEKLIEIGYLPEKEGLDGKTIQHVFYVKDNGVGIPLEFHDEVFRIFKRLQHSGEQEEGTGVGLTFVKKIVERHGGRIWLESNSGQGTIFYFTLGRAPHVNA